MKHPWINLLIALLLLSTRLTAQENWVLAKTTINAPIEKVKGAALTKFIQRGAILESESLSQLVFSVNTCRFYNINIAGASCKDRTKVSFVFATVEKGIRVLVGFAPGDVPIARVGAVKENPGIQQDLDEIKAELEATTRAIK